MAKVRLEYEVNKEDAKAAIESLNKAVKKTDQERIASTKRRQAEEAKANEIQKQSINGLKLELAGLKKQYNSLSETQRKNSAEGRKLEANIAKLSGTIKRSNERVREQEKVNKSLLITQQRQVKSIKDLREFTNALVFQRDRLNLNTKESRKQFDLLTKQINQNNIALFKHDQQIGRNQRNVGNYGAAIKSAGLRLIAFAGGLTLITRGLRAIVSDFIAFSSASAELRSILDVTSKEAAVLTKQAKILGRTTASSATEVTKLQTELARLGFTINEISAATPAVQQLAIAIGGDLAQAAEVAGITLRQFGLDASETGRVVDVIAKSFSTSPVTIERFQNAMKFAGVEAKRAGFSIEEATAQIAALSKQGILGSKAGTALRRIYLAIGKSGVTGAEGLDKLAKSGLTVEEAFDEVGLRAQTALLVLSEGKTTVDEFTKAFENAEGAARKLAEIRLDTLEGDLKLFRSAIESANLALSGDGGILRSFVQLGTFLARFIPTWIAGFEAIGGTIGNFIFVATQQFIGFFDLIGTGIGVTVDLVTTSFNALAQSLAGSIKAIFSGESITDNFKKSFREASDSFADSIDLLVKKKDEYVALSAKSDKQLVDGTVKAFQDANAKVIKGQEEAAQARADILAKETEDVEKEIQKITNEEIAAINKANLAKLQAQDAANEDFLLREQDQKDRILAIRQELVDKTDEILDRELLSLQDNIDIEFALKKQQLEKEKKLLDEALAANLQNNDDVLLAKESLDAQIIALNEEKNNALLESDRAGLELNKALATATATGIGDILGVIGQESDKVNKALGEALKKTLTSVIDVFLEAELAKLSLASFSTFGASLLAIGPAIALATAAKVAINAIKFEKGGIPEKASRGTLLKGPSHAEGGIPIEAEGNEAIINKKSTAKFLPLLSAINSHNGNGVSFSGGEGRYSGLLDKLNQGYKLGGIPKMQGGGLPNVPTSQPIDSTANLVDQIRLDRLDRTSNQDIPVVNIITSDISTSYAIEMQRKQNNLPNQGINTSELT